MLWYPRLDEETPSREQKCPNCRVEMKKRDLKPVARYFKSILDRLIISCEYFTNGCDFAVPLEITQTLAKHVEDCTFHPGSSRKCPIAGGCESEYPIAEMKSHNCLDEMKQKLEIVKRISRGRKKSLKLLRQSESKYMAIKLENKSLKQDNERLKKSFEEQKTSLKEKENELNENQKDLKEKTKDLETIGEIFKRTGYFAKHHTSAQTIHDDNNNEVRSDEGKRSRNIKLRSRSILMNKCDSDESESEMRSSKKAVSDHMRRNKKTVKSDLNTRSRSRSKTTSPSSSSTESDIETGSKSTDSFINDGSD